MKTILHRKSLIVLAALFLASAAPAREFLVFFGTFTNAMSKGIYVSRLDDKTGKLSAPELAAESPSPAYLAIPSNDKFLYAVNENSGNVSAFALDQHSGHLTFLNQQSSGGPGPCHVGVDATSSVLLAANYGGGSVKSFSLNGDGSIGADGSFIQHHGSSVNTSRQAAPHAHFICADPSNRYALACDLGLDKVMIYRINATKGTLEESSFGVVPPGSGARHLAFSPSGKIAYVVNEMGCTVTSFAWDSVAGKLAPIETVSALPADVTALPSYTSAEIRSVGKYVYVTIRGHDSVTVLTANGRTGRLTFLQNIPCGGKIPRGLGVDPTGHWLIVGNQKTDNAVEFDIDAKTGKLSPTGQELKVGSPVDVEFVESK